MTTPVDVRAAIAAAIDEMRACDCTGPVEALLEADVALAKLIGAAETARMLAGQINRNDDDAINLSCDILDVLAPALAACKGAAS